MRRETMGSRDMHRKETKKAKRGNTKATINEIIAPSPEVEVIRKKRKPSLDE